MESSSGSPPSKLLDSESFSWVQFPPPIHTTRRKPPAQSKHNFYRSLRLRSAPPFPARKKATIPPSLNISLTVVWVTFLRNATSGFSLGAAISLAVVRTAFYGKIDLHKPPIGFVTAVCAVGLVGGFLALFMEKQMVVIATSYGGAFAATYGIGNSGFQTRHLHQPVQKDEQETKG